MKMMLAHMLHKSKDERNRKYGFTIRTRTGSTGEGFILYTL